MQGLRKHPHPWKQLSSTNQIGYGNRRINYLSRMWEQEAISHCERETLENSRLRKLKSRSRVTNPTVWIGKEGVSEDLVRQVENQLRTRELVKLKLQRSALAKFATFKVAEEIAASTGSTLIDVIGHTFTLYKKDEATRTRKRPNADTKRHQVN